MRVASALRVIFSVYEACAVDTARAFRGSWFIGVALSLLYSSAFLAGLLIGATLYDFVGPLLDVLLLVLRPPGDLIADVSALALLLYVSSVSTCLIARTLVRAIIYLLYEMRGDVVFYLAVVAALVCAVIALLLALMPPFVSEDTLSIAVGFAVLGCLGWSALAFWFFLRFRWSGYPKEHKFDREIGLAWSHMSDPRRARFGFDRGS